MRWSHWCRDCAQLRSIKQSLTTHPMIVIDQLWYLFLHCFLVRPTCHLLRYRLLAQSGTSEAIATQSLSPCEVCTSFVSLLYSSSANIHVCIFAPSMQGCKEGNLIRHCYFVRCGTSHGAYDPISPVFLAVRLRNCTA